MGASTAWTGPKADTIKATRRQLNFIGDPCSVANGVPMGVEEMGLVSGVELDEDGNVVIDLRLTSPTCHMVGYFHVEAKRRALEVPGVQSVEIRSDSGLDWSPEMMSDDAKRRRRAALRARGIPLAQEPSHLGGRGSVVADVAALSSAVVDGRRGI